MCAYTVLVYLTCSAENETGSVCVAMETCVTKKEDDEEVFDLRLWPDLFRLLPTVVDSNREDPKEDTLGVDVLLCSPISTSIATAVGTTTTESVDLVVATALCWVWSSGEVCAELWKVSPDVGVGDDDQRALLDSVAMSRLTCFGARKSGISQGMLDGESPLPMLCSHFVSVLAREKRCGDWSVITQLCASSICGFGGVILAQGEVVTRLSSLLWQAKTGLCAFWRGTFAVCESCGGEGGLGVKESTSHSSKTSASVVSEPEDSGLGVSSGSVMSCSLLICAAVRVVVCCREMLKPWSKWSSDEAAPQVISPKLFPGVLLLALQSMGNALDEQIFSAIAFSGEVSGFSQRSKGGKGFIRLVRWWMYATKSSIMSWISPCKKSKRYAICVLTQTNKSKSLSFCHHITSNGSHKYRYTLVQWDWFSDITGCMWLKCIQWLQRTNFTPNWL